MKSIKLEGRALEVAKAIASTSSLVNNQINDIMTKANAECERISAQGNKEVGGMVDALYLITGATEDQRPQLDLRYLNEFGIAFLTVGEAPPKNAPDESLEQGLQ